MLPGAPGAGVCARLALLFVLVAAPVSSLAGEQDPATAVLFHGEDSGRAGEWEDLRRAVEAHLSPYAVRVQSTAVPGLQTTPEATPGPCGPDRVACIWLDESSATLQMWIPSLGEHTRTRSLPDRDDGWLARCEMVASIVLSELEPVLGGFPSPPPSATGAAPSAAPSAEASPATSSVVEAAPPSPPTIFLGLGVAYLPVLLSADAPYLHGLGLSAVAGIGPRFEIGLGFDFVQPLVLGPEYGDGRLIRQVLRAGVSANLGSGAVDLCLGGRVVIEFTRVAGLDYTPVDGSAVEMHERGGLGGFARIRLRPLQWFSLVAEGGADVYLTPLQLVDGDRELARRTTVQPRIAIGVVGWFGRP